MVKNNENHIQEKEFLHTASPRIGTMLILIQYNFYYISFVVSIDT